MTKKILLVEDDLDDRALFETFFAGRKDILLMPPVANGLEMIEFLQSISDRDNLPDLIVVDQNMPKMNGRQTLSFLKSSPLFSKIRVVIYSTYTDSALITDCKNLGADMVAIKPIDDEGYQKMMDDFLKIF